jgi:hypothetical protein
LHRQFTDPGIPSGWKVIHSALTFGVAFPSLSPRCSTVGGDSSRVGSGECGGLAWYQESGWLPSSGSSGLPDTG